MSNKLKTILFRVDSSSAIGTGHIMRDLVLAEQYPNSSIIFATQDLKGNLNSKILEAGHAVENLNSNNVEELIELVQHLSVDMVIIDHYEIDDKFEKLLKEQTSVQLMVLDDTYEKHHCDILLNHNVSGESKRYEGLVPSCCELRCGSEYTLIRDEFIREKKKKTIFLAMGGADHSNINIDILEVLKEFTNIEVNLVTTTANMYLDNLKKYVKSYNNITLHINTQQVAKLMHNADIAIVSPSVILNEVIYMNTAFLAIKTAENQIEMYRYLVENNLPVMENFCVDKFKDKMKGLLDG